MYKEASVTCTVQVWGQYRASIGAGITSMSGTCPARIQKCFDVPMLYSREVKHHRAKNLRFPYEPNKIEISGMKI